MRVKTYDGTLAERKDVRRIKGEYYKHSDIITIDSVRYRCTNSRVVRHVVTNNLHDANSIRSSAIKGVKIVIGRKGDILYEKLLMDSLIDYPIRLFYHNEGMKSVFVSVKAITEMKKHNYLHRNDFTGAYWVQEPDASPGIIEHFIELANEYQGFMYERLQYSMFKNLKFFENHKYTPMSKLGLDHHMSGMTFGAEFETSSGKVAHNKLLDLGIAPLRDGSISGYEFTTIPLTSIDHLKDIIDELNGTCKITFKDSLHFHIGGVPRSTEFLLKIFKLSQKLQNEFYAMVPKYKLKDEHHIKRREQNYTNKLPTLDILNPLAINRIVKFLSDGTESSNSITPRPHPNDPSGEHKWQLRNRYTCINFVNYIYGTTGTVEFRLHQGTVNAYKAIYWLLINVALIKYADAHSVEEIQNNRIDLSLVLNDVYSGEPGVIQALTAYVSDATTYFKNYDPDDVHFNADSNADKTWKPRVKLW